jgi:hypothetical protein
MNQHDKIRFTAAMKALAVNASVEITKDTLRLYFEALKDFDISEIEIGTHKLLLEWEYNRMPPLSALVKKIQGEQPKIEDRALCEANKILDHLRVHGAGVCPEMSDPITRQLMTTRWHYQTWAGQCVESENHWWVKEFVEAYRSTNAVNPALEIPDRVRPMLKIIGGER